MMRETGRRLLGIGARAVLRHIRCLKINQAAIQISPLERENIFSKVPTVLSR